MRIPGFTAARSLSVASGAYGMAAGWEHGANGGSVVPQLPKSIGFCMSDCDNTYDWGSVDNAKCKADCMDGGGGDGGNGGGGGGGGGGPRDRCGRCITTGPHKGQRYCTTRAGAHYWDDC